MIDRSLSASRLQLLGLRVSAMSIGAMLVGAVLTGAGLCAQVRFHFGTSCVPDGGARAAGTDYPRLSQTIPLTESETHRASVIDTLPESERHRVS